MPFFSTKILSASPGGKKKNIQGISLAEYYLPSYLSYIWVTSGFSNEEVGKGFEAEQSLSRLVSLLSPV